MNKEERKFGSLTEAEFKDTLRRTEADKWLHHGPGRRLLYILAVMTLPLIGAHAYALIKNGNLFDLSTALNIPWYIPATILFVGIVFWESQREKTYKQRDEKLDEIEFQIETRATAWAGERLFQSYLAAFVVLLWFPSWYHYYSWALPLIFAAEFIWIRWAKRSMLREELAA